MAESDWDSVTYLKKRTPRAAEMRSKQAIASAQRHGQGIETTEKCGNKQHSANKDTAKLDRETEELHHERVALDVGKLIQQGRLGKKLTQKELATVSHRRQYLENIKKINEKPNVIIEYEQGKAIPNNQILGKIERVIGLKLRGKDKGKTLEQSGKGKK